MWPLVLKAIWIGASMRSSGGVNSRFDLSDNYLGFTRQLFPKLMPWPVRAGQVVSVLSSAGSRMLIMVDTLAWVKGEAAMLKHRLVQCGLIAVVVVVPSWLWFGLRYGLWPGLLNALGITALTLVLMAIWKYAQDRRK